MVKLEKKKNNPERQRESNLPCGLNDRGGWDSKSLYCLCPLHYQVLSKREKERQTEGGLIIFLCIHAFFKTMAAFQRLLQWKTSVARTLNPNMPPHPYQSELKFYKLQFMQLMYCFLWYSFCKWNRTLYNFIFQIKHFQGWQLLYFSPAGLWRHNTIFFNIIYSFL